MGGIEVLLVDDHAVVRAGYRRFLEGSAVVASVTEAGSADEGYAAFCERRPHVCVIDLSMPRVGGFELIRRIVRREPAARVLAFSMHEERLFAQQALQAGAMGYITKNSAPDTLIEAVERVHRGQHYLAPEIAPLRAGEQPGAHGLDVLSTKEFEIFRMIAQGITLGEIAAALSLSHKTVANYQSAIKEKLGAGTTAALVHMAIRAGVIRIPGPSGPVN